MTEEVYRIVDIAFKLLTIILVMVAYYQLKETKQKRHIDMYWKIAEIYTSEEQQNARSKIHNIRHFVEKIQGTIPHQEIVKRYNHEYHVSPNMENRKVDKIIINRIRFLNQTGVLLRKKLVDEDLLFGLIGVGLEYDYPVIRIVIEAHRSQHDMQYIYKELEGIWSAYQKWKPKAA